eukprot:1194481-Pyramimonas_sp.AAC.1
MHGLKYTPHGTLRVAWKDFEVKVMDGFTQLKFMYSRPFLTNTDDYDPSVARGKPVHRVRSEFDDVEVKKFKKDKLAKK